MPRSKKPLELWVAFTSNLNTFVYVNWTSYSKRDLTELARKENPYYTGPLVWKKMREVRVEDKDER